MRAGVPTSAATVDTAQVLRELGPALARQCEEPEALLLPQRCWPTFKPKGFQMVDTTYPQLIERAEAAELVELVGTDGVIALNGEPVVQSAFAVPNNEVEDRWFLAMNLSTRWLTRGKC